MRSFAVVASALLVLSACGGDDSPTDDSFRREIADQLDVQPGRVEVTCDSDDGCTAKVDGQDVPTHSESTGPRTDATVWPFAEVQTVILDHGNDLGIALTKVTCASDTLVVVSVQDGARCQVEDESGTTGDAVVRVDESGRLVVVELTSG